MLERLQEALRDADERDMVYECVDTLRSMMPDLIECAEALETLAHEFELLYAFAISNGIPEAGTPPHLPARAALAKLENVK